MCKGKLQPGLLATAAAAGAAGGGGVMVVVVAAAAAAAVVTVVCVHVLRRKLKMSVGMGLNGRLLGGSSRSP